MKNNAAIVGRHHIKLERMGAIPTLNWIGKEAIVMSAVPWPKRR
jgi:hypothetical protein